LLELAALRIASFNVENLSGAPAATSPEERYAILRPQLERLAADVLCLQEVDGARDNAAGPRSLKVLDAFLAGTPYSGYHRSSTCKPGTGEPRDKHNLVILSRWPIEHIAQYANDLVPAPRYQCVTADPRGGDDAIAWDRPILEARIALPGGRKLHAINMHLKAPLASFIAGQKLGPFAWRSVSGWAEGCYLAAIRRAGQALEARILADRIFDCEPDALLAVCGDFNAEERETPFRILAGDTEDTGNGQLAFRELIALEHTLPEFRRFTVIHAGRRLMLDHILVSRPLLACYETMEVHNEALGDEIVGYTLIERNPESYHAPIVASFRDPAAPPVTECSGTPQISRR
jgi:endonuclease/exonuclease/phosphatase family metal-dependent hydrolase